ncbi:MAG: hypothetical protein IH914_07810 [candidate division Zixibacteria bacterium]|nr:hypothetical protein [candidate division Zixibacteria bacterium]
MGHGHHGHTPATSRTREPEDRLELSTPRSTELKTDDHDGETAPEAKNATYERKFSQLRYSLDLSFNAQALQTTIHRLSMIQTEDATSVSETFESLSSLNIGLGVNFQMQGLSVSERAELSDSRGSEKTGHYQRHESADKFEKLLKHASRTNENLPSEHRHGHQLAVNRFALRYSSDAQFSFSHFSRFNTQVTVLGKVSPEELNGLTASAGELAEFASNDVMGAFLDSVDAYLGDSEENLLAKIDEFFNMAGSELGLSPEAIAQAKEQLSSTVVSFFDRVESSISALKNQVFGLPSAESTTLNPIQTGGGQPVPDQRLAVEPNRELLDAMIDALDTLEEEPVDTSTIFNSDTPKEPEDELAGVLT